MPPWVTGPIARLVLVAVLAAALAFGVGKALDWRRSALANAATVQQQAQQATAATAITDTGADTAAARAESDATITTAREAFLAGMEEARRHDPQAAARADRPVPERVRDAYRTRRLARERPAGPERER